MSVHSMNRFLAAVGCLVGPWLTQTARAELGVPISSPTSLNSAAANDSAFDLEVQLAGDGHDNWVAVWSASENQGGPFGIDRDVFVARSIDNGEHWSLMLPLNTNAATDAGNDNAPHVATDGQGHWIAVWSSGEDLGGTIGTDSDILFSRSIDNGASWTPPAALNTNAANDPLGIDRDARIATDGSGHWVAVWTSDEDLNGIDRDDDILFARSIDNGAHWSDPAPLNANAADDDGDDLNPSIAIDKEGRCVAVLHSNSTLGNTIGTDADILVARSLDAGLNWSIPIPLNSDANADTPNDIQAKVALDDDGHCVVAWMAAEPGGFPLSMFRGRMARSDDGGASWSVPVPIRLREVGDRNIETSPSVATDRAGNWVIVWTLDGIVNTPQTDSDLLVIRSADNGANWSSPSVLNSDGATDALDARDGSPTLATDVRGNWLTAWVTNKHPSGAVGSEDDLRVARFALPDCNSNLVADSGEVLLGLLPDINFNNVPDVCEILAGPPPGTNGGCGVGLCGGGMATLGPMVWVGIACMGRVFRRPVS